MLEIYANLDIAEVHALNQKPMYMKEWLQTIDDYLKMLVRYLINLLLKKHIKSRTICGKGEFKVIKSRESFLIYI